jgi:hypothetical protein
VSKRNCCCFTHSGSSPHQNAHHNCGTAPSADRHCSARCTAIRLRHYDQGSRNVSRQNPGPGGGPSFFVRSSRSDGRISQYHHHHNRVVVVRGPTTTTTTTTGSASSSTGSSRTTTCTTTTGQQFIIIVVWNVITGFFQGRGRRDLFGWGFWVVVAAP